MMVYYYFGARRRGEKTSLHGRVYVGGNTNVSAYVARFRFASPILRGRIVVRERSGKEKLDGIVVLHCMYSRRNYRSISRDTCTVRVSITARIR